MSFLQSPEWENFQQSLGRKTWRVRNQLIIQHTLPFGFNYLYSPRMHIENADSFFREAQLIAQKEKAIFLKVDPSDNFQFSMTNFQSILNFQFSKSLQPRRTVMLDLSRPEDELLKSMHEKTRYNIRLAERRAVTIRQSNDIETFWNLLQETAERDGFHTHERQYYEKLLAARSENFSNELFFAEYRSKVLAAALVNFYETGSHKIVTYLHGASSREHKEVMAPHLLHWRIIQEARKSGFDYYDLWGIDEKRWPGVSRFKKGFGGEIMEYPGAIDVIYRPIWYFICRLIRKIV